METIRVWVQRIAARAAREDRGASLVEYALLVALIALVCIVAISLIGVKSNSQYSRYDTCVGWAGSNSPVPAQCH